MNSYPPSVAVTTLRSIDRIRILSKTSEVLPFVNEAQKHSDREKNALGFLPRQVLMNAAHENKFFVAASFDKERFVYAGHLYFGDAFPNARIFQLYVQPKFRRHGIARKLVEVLAETLEAHNYLSIRARVANDLSANTAWERLGFFTVRQVPGRGIRNRMINVRVRDLRTPTLFGISDSLPVTDLRLAAKITVGPPVYAIDLNVFFDVVRQRARAEDAAKVISAGLSNLAKIVIAEEFVAELRRTANASSLDPILEFAAELPTIPRPPAHVLTELTDQLKTITFPDRTRLGKLQPQDHSDITHLATAIHHSLTGFVTGERAILRERNDIYWRFGLRVLDVHEFAEAVKTSEERIRGTETRVSGRALHIGEIGEDHEGDLASFLEQFSISDGFREKFVSQRPFPSARKRLVVTSDAEIVCTASWDCISGLNAVAEVCLIANEDHLALETGLDVLLDRVCREASRNGAILMHLNTPSGHVISRAIARIRGFTASTSSAGIHSKADFLHKVSVGRPIESKDWISIRAWLKQVAGLVLPATLPKFSGDDPLLTFSSHDGTPGKIKLSTLETLLSPTLVILQGRPGVIVPIKRRFADDLLGSGAQLKLVASPTAIALSERIYFSSHRNARLLKSGCALVFYESGKEGGRSAAIAVARVVETVVANKADISATLLQHGVMESEEIESLTTDDKIAVTTFDNLMRLKKTISLQRLRQIGCVNAANLVSATGLAAEHLASIIQEGKPSV